MTCISCPIHGVVTWSGFSSSLAYLNGTSVDIYRNPGINSTTGGWDGTYGAGCSWISMADRDNYGTWGADFFLEQVGSDWQIGSATNNITGSFGNITPGAGTCPGISFSAFGDAGDSGTATIVWDVPVDPVSDYFELALSLGPILYYRLDEDPTLDIVKDFSTFYPAKNGNPEGALTQSGSIIKDTGLSYNFGGGHIEAPPGSADDTLSLVNLTDCSIKFWAIWSGGDHNQRFFDFGNGITGDSTGKYGYLTPSHHTNGKLTFRMSASGATGEISHNLVGPTLKPGEIYFIVITISGITRKLYINGTLYSTITTSGINFRDLDIVNAFIGKSQWTIDPAFSGVMDEFAIYQYPLSAEQIHALWTTGSTTISTSLLNLRSFLTLTDSFVRKMVWTVGVTSALTLSDIRGKKTDLASSFVVTDDVGVNERLLNVREDSLYFVEGVELIDTSSTGREVYVPEILKIKQAVVVERDYAARSFLTITDSFDTPGLKFDTVTSALILTDTLTISIPGHYFLTDILTINDIGHHGEVILISVGNTINLADVEGDKENPLHKVFSDRLNIFDVVSHTENPKRQQLVSSIIFTDTGKVNLHRFDLVDTLLVVDRLHVNLIEQGLIDSLSILDTVFVQPNHQYLEDDILITDKQFTRTSILNIHPTDNFRLDDRVQIGVGLYHAFFADTLTFVDRGFRLHEQSIADSLTISQLVERIKFADANNTIVLTDTVLPDVRHIVSNSLSINDYFCLQFKGTLRPTDTLTLLSVVGYVLTAAADGNGDTEFIQVINKYVDDFVNLNDTVKQTGIKENACDSGVHA